MYTPEQKHYWRQNIKVILALLAVWAGVSVGMSILFVEQLNQFTLGNIPLGFWMAQQGSIFVFVLIILVYAIVMDRLDHSHHMDKE
jgi:putative solute:sodium symporter small subunit